MEFTISHLSTRIGDGDNSFKFLSLFEVKHKINKKRSFSLSLFSWFSNSFKFCSHHLEIRAYNHIHIFFCIVTTTTKNIESETLFLFLSFNLKGFNYLRKYFFLKDFKVNIVSKVLKSEKKTNRK
jgi:hypothetical protein